MRATEVEWTSIKSMSMKAMTPESDKIKSSWVKPIASVDAAVTVGASLVPVMVILTTWVTEPP